MGLVGWAILVGVGLSEALYCRGLFVPKFLPSLPSQV